MAATVTAAETQMDPTTTQQPAAPVSNPADAANAPPVPQAQGAAPAVDASAIVKEVRDAIFADLRRAGMFDQKQPKAKDDPKKGEAAQPTLDHLRYRELDRALSRAGFADKLSPKAYKTLERSFAEDDPGDASLWVKDYFEGFSAVAPQPAAPAQPAQPQSIVAPQAQAPGNVLPVSDRGAPPAPRVPLEDADIIRMSESDRNALIKEKGVRWYRDTLAKQLKGRQIVTRR